MKKPVNGGAKSHDCEHVWVPLVHFLCLWGCVGGAWELCDGYGLVVRLAFTRKFTPLFTKATPPQGCSMLVWGSKRRSEKITHTSTVCVEVAPTEVNHIGVAPDSSGAVP